MLPINFNYIKIESHSNNCNKSNYNGDKIGDEKQRSDNLKGFE